MRPKGFSLAEALLAISVLLVAFSIGMEALHEAQTMRKERERRHVAQELIGLALERLRALPPEALTPNGGIRVLPIPESFQEKLGDGRCLLEVDRKGMTKLARVTLRVEWDKGRQAETGVVLFGDGR